MNEMIRYESGEEARNAANVLFGAMKGFYARGGKVTESLFEKYDNARGQIALFRGDLSDLPETEDLRLRFSGGLN